MSWEKIVISDLDGTLKSYLQPVSVSNMEALRALDGNSVLKVIATGRSLHASKQVLPADLSIDYLVFSCGAGILNWKTGEILVSYHLDGEEISTVSACLVELGINFMIHAEIPGNHFFDYFISGFGNPDFHRRLERQATFARAGDRNALPEKACQFVAIVPQVQGESVFFALKNRFPGLKVLRTTSPLDQTSIWIEILPEKASKSAAGKWIAEKHRLLSGQVYALGNDYNDQDLLEWAGNSLLVSRTCPAEMRALFKLLITKEEDALKNALLQWGMP